MGRREIGGLGKESPTRYEIGGIVTPVRARTQRVRALEVFNDEAPTEAPESLRQRWPSQSELLGYEKGSESGGNYRREFPLHFALPETRREPALLVTEGALRAEVMAAIYGAIVVAVADLERQLDQVLEAIAGFALSGVFFSPNQVSETNLLMSAAGKKGFRVGRADWEKMSKCSYKACLFS